MIGAPCLKREIYDNGNSAVVLPYDPDRKTVLLTRQLRLPIFLQDGREPSVEACAGKLDGEKAELRIVKEMQEELGYRIPKVQRLFELYVSPAAIMEKISFFTCAYSPTDKISDGGGAQGGGGGYRRGRDDVGGSCCDDRDRRDYRRKDGRPRSIFEQSIFERSHAGCGSRLDRGSQYRLLL